MTWLPSLALALLASLLAAPASQAAAKTTALQPYELHYQARAQGFNVSTARTLEKSTAGYTLRQTSSAMLMQTNETSEFLLTTAGNISPRSFSYQRKVFGKSKTRQTHFYPSRLRAVYTENSDMPRHLAIPADIHDVYSFQEQLRLELVASQGRMTERTYNVLERDKVRLNRFRASGSEWISTPVGYLHTLKLERVRENDDKKTTIWLAKDWGYVIVSMLHRETGEPDYRLDIRRGSVGGKTISGPATRPAR